jgi:arylsulfatase A-like enzyme
MKRNWWVLGIVAVLVAWVAPAKAGRPNFLFVYLDDQRYDAMGVVQREQGERGRFPWLRTPNMDRVAAEGVRFRNAFVVNSLCSPSRSCFLTGRYSHSNGVGDNHTPLSADQVTSSGLLRAAGYATAYFGKWHHGQQRERPGFEYVASYLGQGTYNDCRFNVNGVMTPTTGWVDDVSTDFAVAYLREHVKRGDGRPFDVVVGYKTCHTPRVPAEQDRGLYEGEEVRAVPNLSARAPFSPAGAATAPAGGEARAVRRNRNDEGLLNYFRGVTSADRSLGRLLDALDELGLAEDTVVVFSSDNGYYMGEHGLGDKRSAYEESVRVPLVVRYPKLGRKGVVVDAMAANVDLAPTLLDFAGVAVPKEMHGRSWRPVLEGKAEELREAFFYEYFRERGYATPTTLAVRTRDAKLIKYPGHEEWTELFDLDADPYETKNLWSEPAAAELRARMGAEFDRQAKAVEFRMPEIEDGAAPARRGRS